MDFITVGRNVQQILELLLLIYNESCVTKFWSRKVLAFFALDLTAV